MQINVEKLLKNLSNQISKDQLEIDRTNTALKSLPAGDTTRKSVLIEKRTSHQYRASALRSIRVCIVGSIEAKSVDETSDPEMESAPGES